MGTLTAQRIIDNISGALMNDAAKVRFKQTDSLAILNEALRFIAAANPSSYSGIVPFTCALGSVQAVPANMHTFMGGVYNLDVSDVPGRQIDTVQRETLDVPDPEWRLKTPGTQVRHVMADDTLPLVFHTYPPVVAGTKIAIRGGLIPVDIALGDVIPMEDTYETPIKNFILSRLWQKNAEYAGNPQLAQQYWQSVLQFLGVKAQVDPATSADSETRAERS